MHEVDFDTIAPYMISKIILKLQERKIDLTKWSISGVDTIKWTRIDSEQKKHDLSKNLSESSI